MFVMEKNKKITKNREIEDTTRKDGNFKCVTKGLLGV